MSKFHFCTYFDHNYLAQGLVLYHSLMEFAPSSTLHVLALSEKCCAILKSLNLQNMRLICLEELERFDPVLLDVKRKRSPAEYIFTLTPSWIRFLLHSGGDMEMLTYLDADAAFFSSPETALGRVESSVGLVGHRFPTRLNHLLCYGRYNVGWNTFALDARSNACVDWWRERCLEWCYDVYDQGRFADQAYLDQWPELFGAQEIPHKGINVAPWNVDTFAFSSSNGMLWVDDDPLVFFHFHGVRRILPSLYATGLEKYGGTLTPLLREHVFKPYLDQLISISQEHGLTLWTSKNRSNKGLFISIYSKYMHVIRVLMSKSFLFFS